MMIIYNLLIRSRHYYGPSESTSTWKDFLKLFKRKQIIYHGGCIDCKSQEKFGRKRCKGCSYYNNDYNLPDLFMKIGGGKRKGMGKYENK